MSAMARLSLFHCRLSISANSTTTIIFSPHPQYHHHYLSSSPQRRFFAISTMVVNPREKPEVYRALMSALLDMCKGLRQEGLDKQARDLYYQTFAVYKGRCKCLLVVTGTAQIVVAFNKGKPLDALSVYSCFLENGIEPNAYTYAVLIKGFSKYGITMEAAKRIMIEMMGKRMKPNAATIVALMEGLVREGKAVEGRELVAEMTGLGFMPGDDAMEEGLEGKEGPMVDNLRNLLFPK